MTKSILAIAATIIRCLGSANRSGDTRVPLGMDESWMWLPMIACSIAIRLSDMFPDLPLYPASRLPVPEFEIALADHLQAANQGITRFLVPWKKFL